MCYCPRVSIFNILTTSFCLLVLLGLKWVSIFSVAIAVASLLLSEKPLFLLESALHTVLATLGLVAY